MSLYPQQIYNLFLKRHEANQPPPTFQEIIEGTDITSTSVVKYHLERMEAEGLLEHAPGGKSRAYWLPVVPNGDSTRLVAELRQRVADLTRQLKITEQALVASQEEVERITALCQARKAILEVADRRLHRLQASHRAEIDELQKQVSKEAGWRAFAEK